jgi:NADH-ubiquinone oxidoreductase chain 5
MSLLIILLPLISSFISGFLGRYIGRTGAVFVTCSLIGFTFLITWFLFYEIALCHSNCNIKLFPWIISHNLYVEWGFLFDTLTVSMLIVVITVSFLVHVYSMSYMNQDPHLARFMSYLSLFTFFMIILVTADNFLQLFLGWEGVGLSSYLLINFWFTRLQANKSAIKAIIVNRVGDFGLSLGILAIFYVFHSLDYSVVLGLVPYFKDEVFILFNYEFNALFIISLFLFIGAIGKSAQIFLHTWLPDAMEGPTPVSALIHAATMVTAGVFVLLRVSPLLEYAPLTLFIITLFGSVTAFFAATAGLVQNDLKRVIAYSTCSQLGYMIFACGLSNYSISFFHLMNHAFFKALLFLSAGSVIHALADEQDMRKMGGLLKLLPFTYVMILIGSLALMGFPFLTGFYSKDVILELAFVNYSVIGLFAYWLGVISAFFTAFYSFRLIYLTFITKSNTYRKLIEGVHDAPLPMAIPLIILAFGSIFIGYFLKDMVIGIGSDFWGNALFYQINNVHLIEAEFLYSYVKIIPIIFSFSGAIFAIILNSYFKINLYNFKISFIGFKLYSFFSKKWYFDLIYNTFIVRTILNFGYNISFKFIDRGLIELIGPLGIVRILSVFIKRVSLLQSGYIYHYTFIIISGITLIVVLLTIGYVDIFIKISFLSWLLLFCFLSDIIINVGMSK